MPVVHIYAPEGWVSTARKGLKVEKVTEAVVEAEGVPFTRDITYMLIHNVADGGWSFRGDVYRQDDFKKHIPDDPKVANPA